jgi:hypothetical protein
VSRGQEQSWGRGGAGEEAEAAKARLEDKKAKRRKRYAKNREKINEKRREMYTFKESTES